MDHFGRSTDSPTSRHGWQPPAPLLLQFHLEGIVGDASAGRTQDDPLVTDVAARVVLQQHVGLDDGVGLAGPTQVEITRERNVCPEGLSSFP
jgi:hypothetical protein